MSKEKQEYEKYEATEAVKEPVVSKEATVSTQKSRKIGGMERTKWAEKTMFSCPRCRATTFVETEAKNHTC